MEKFGLFDIIDKFNSASKGENDFSKSERKTDKQPTVDDRSLLKDPDDFAPPQYAMNAKMQAFIRRHDELVAAVPKPEKKKRGRKKQVADPTTEKSEMR